MEEDTRPIQRVRWNIPRTLYPVYLLVLLHLRYLHLPVGHLPCTRCSLLLDVIQSLLNPQTNTIKRCFYRYKYVLYIKKNQCKLSKYETSNSYLMCMFNVRGGKCTESSVWCKRWIESFWRIQA